MRLAHFPLWPCFCLAPRVATPVAALETHRARCAGRIAACAGSDLLHAALSIPIAVLQQADRLAVGPVRAPRALFVEVANVAVRVALDVVALCRLAAVVATISEPAAVPVLRATYSLMPSGRPDPRRHGADGGVNKA